LSEARETIAKLQTENEELQRQLDIRLCDDANNTAQSIAQSAKIARLKERDGMLVDTLTRTIEILNTDKAITDTLWYDDYCTVVETLESVKKCYDKEKDSDA
jgi:hypothetical protein